MEELQASQTILKVKEEIKRIYPDMKKEFPVDYSPQSLTEVKRMMSAQSANMMTLALYSRALSQYIKQRTAEIVLNNPNVRTPKKEVLEAMINQELAEIKSYHEQLEELLKIANTRIRIAQSILRTSELENYSSVNL